MSYVVYRDERDDKFERLRRIQVIYHHPDGSVYAAYDDSDPAEGLVRDVIAALLRGAIRRHLNMGPSQKLEDERVTVRDYLMTKEGAEQ